MSASQPRRPSSCPIDLFLTVLQNRAFQKVTPSMYAYYFSIFYIVIIGWGIDTPEALTAWHPLNNASSIVVVADSTPLSEALPNALQLTTAKAAEGTVGFYNEGWWGTYARVILTRFYSRSDTGIKVDPSWTYNTSLYYRFPSTSNSSASGSSNITISLRSSSGQTLASSKLPISPSVTWQQLNTTLKPTGPAPKNNNNTFVVELDEISTGGVNFGLVSLFPPTFNGRENGMRVDIAQALKDIGPSIFRLPGGNNLVSILSENLV